MRRAANSNTKGRGKGSEGLPSMELRMHVEIDCVSFLDRRLQHHSLPFPVEGRVSVIL